MGGFGVLWGSPTFHRLSGTLNRDKRLLWSACTAGCSCSTCASRVSRSLTLTRRAACGLWEISIKFSCGLWAILINSSKDSTRSGKGCKLEADEWVFWELLFIFIIHFKIHFNMLDTGLAENLDIQILGRIILYGSNKTWDFGPIDIYQRGILQMAGANTKQQNVKHFHTCFDVFEEIRR